MERYTNRPVNPDRAWKIVREVLDRVFGKTKDFLDRFEIKN